MDVLTDPVLKDGARAMFCLLLDLSLDPEVNNRRRGEICISNIQLQERLNRSGRAIFGWTKELVAQRHIWVSKKLRPNMKPMNVFHITELQPVRHGAVEVANDGLWGNGYRRPDSPMPLGARAHPCKKRHVLLDRFGAPMFSNLPQNSAQNGNSNGSHPQNLRVTPPQNDTRDPQDLREESAKLADGIRTKRHLGPARFAGDQGFKEPDLEQSGDVRQSPTEKVNNDSRANASKKAFKKGEQVYLTDVAIALNRHNAKTAEAEMLNSGGWWRSIYRENSDKAERVLAEIKRMIKERVTFTKNPGACAVDLWKRWA